MNGTPKFDPKVLAHSDTLPGWGRAPAPSAANARLPQEPGDEVASRPAQDESETPAATQSTQARPVPRFSGQNRFVETLRKVERQAAIKACVIEGILTFLLVFAIFGTAVDPRRPNVGGFAIGLTVAANILLAGPLTGAAMNPARVFGTGIVTQDEIFYAQQWVYWVGPVAGAIAAALIYNFAILPEGEKKA
jgi:glycerol uptake facilitator-like aquaporin